MAVNDLDEIRELAAACDEHAAALGVAIRQLHLKLSAARQRNDGRGPSGLTVTSALERCAAKYFVGTVLRTPRGPLSAQRGFRQQIELWMTMLSAPKLPPPAAQQPPSLPAA